MNERWISEWDLYLAQLLEPIAQQRYKLQMLFFANTFPIAYHYTLALQLLDRNREDIPELLVPGEWKDEDPTGPRYLCYTNEPEVIESPQTFVPVTVFNPKWIFVPKTTGIARICGPLLEEHKGTDIPFDSFLRTALPSKKYFKSVKIYAEIHDLGVVIAEQIRTSFPGVPVDIFSGLKNKFNLPFFYPKDRCLDALRLFIFGGSLSSYLKRKSNRYVAFELNVGRNSAFNTYMRCDSGAQRYIAEYHTHLYNSTKNVTPSSGKCQPFYSVYREYNELSWLLQHRSSFENADEYARCLREHHHDVANHSRT